jgi:hypothetical protein
MGSGFDKRSPRGVSCDEHWRGEFTCPGLARLRRVWPCFHHGRMSGHSLNSRCRRHDCWIRFTAEAGPGPVLPPGEGNEKDANPGPAARVSSPRSKVLMCS